MDYTKLATEVALPAYVALSDEAAWALLFAPITATRPVPISELSSVAYALGLPARLWGVIYTEAAPIELKAVCQTLIGLMQAPFADVDLLAPGNGHADPAAKQMFDVLVAAELLSLDERATFEALAYYTTTRAAQLDCADATVGDVQRARGGRW